MKGYFGYRITSLREKQQLFLRHVAPLLDMDTNQLSKIEKGIRQMKREHIPALASALNVKYEELLAFWLADQVINVIGEEEVALKAIQVAEKEIMTQKKKFLRNGDQ
jgi:transcriptional regulator with XRE-family HTH domain